MRKNSLTRHILAASLISFVLFFAAQFVLLRSYNAYLEQDTQALLDETLERRAQSLLKMHARLSAVGSFMQVQSVLAHAAELHPGTLVDDDELATAFNMARTISESVDAVQDVILVNTRGVGRSYVSALGVSLVDLIAPLYDYAAPAAERTYFFFPDYASQHDPMFAYVIPLYETDVRGWSSRRLGTAILACSMRSLADMIDLSLLQRSYACTLSEASGAAVVQAGDPKGESLPFSAVREIGETGLRLSARLGQAPFFSSNFFLMILTVDAALFLAVTLLLLFVMQRRLVKPTRKLSREMAALCADGKARRLTPLCIDELDVIVAGANDMIDALERAHEASLRAKSELIESRYRQSEAELFALQSQINPHFLFNTMQCMRALALLHGADDVASIATAMSGLLRYAISGGDAVTLADEVRAIEQYLLISDIRYQYRFAHPIDIPAELRAIPCLRMSIQPLVENALQHGLSCVPTGGIVRIRAYREGKSVLIEVHDNGGGIPPARLAEINRALAMDFDESISREGLQSFGLYNIHRRLRLAYGERCGLSIRSSPGDTRMLLRIPAG